MKPIMYREHFLQFFYHVIKSIKDNIFGFISIIFAIIGTDNEYKKWIYMAFIFLSISIILYSYLKWKKRTFSLLSEIVELKEGIWNVKNIQIPIKNIQNIYTEDTIIRRLFQVSTMKIEVIGSNDITLDLNNTKINEIKKLIFIRNEQKEPLPTPINTKKSPIYKFNFKEYLMMSTVIRYTLVSMFITFSIFIFFQNVYQETKEFKENHQTEVKKEEKWNEKIKEYNNKTKSVQNDWKKNLIKGTKKFILLVIGFYLLNYPIAFISLIIKFRNLKIERTDGKISITFGYFKRSHHEVPVHRIRNLLFSQNYVQKMTGYGQLYLETAGTKGYSSVLLLPIIHQKQLAEKIQEYVPEFWWEEKIIKRKKQELVWMMGQTLIESTILITVLTFFFTFHLWMLVIYIICLHDVVSWKTEGLGIGKHQIKIVNNGLIGFKTKLFQKRYIQHVEIQDELWERKRKVQTYAFSVYSENEKEIYTMEGLTNQYKETFLSFLAKKEKKTQNKKNSYYKKAIEENIRKN